MIWSVLLAGSLIWNIRQEKNETASMAIATARTNISKDMIFRQWVATHGGVYVPPSESTPPNPYLNVPERDITTTSGKQLTLMNPSYALRQLQSMGNKEIGVKAHITSLKLINPHNTADAWEASALRQLDQGASEVTAVTEIDGQTHLRVMQALTVTAECLMCHGQQAYNLGEVRGGISADVPLAIFYAQEQQHIINQAAGHSFLWLIGLMGLGASFRRESQFEATRKSIETDLKEKQRLYSSLVNNVPDFVMRYDRQHRHIFANDKTFVASGKTQDEFIGKTHREMGFPEHLCRLWESAIDRCFITKEPQTEIFTWNSIAGDVVLEWRVIPEFSEDGTIDTALALSRDITEQHHAEEQLLRSRARFRAILDNVPYLMWQKDPEGRYVAINKALFDKTNYKQMKDIIGKTDFDLWPKELAEQYIHDDQEVLSELKHKVIEEKGVDHGQEYWAETFKAPIMDMRGNLLGTTGFAQDITARKKEEGKIRRLAHYDPLTGLPNRILLGDRLYQALAAAQRDKTHMALMFIDLDKFKPINDELGHHVGDLLLKDASERMAHAVRKSDTVARIGGDEFLVLLPLIDAPQDALRIAEKVRTSLNLPFQIAGTRLAISSSIGIAIYPQHGTTEEELIQKADFAMYYAKASGANQVALYQEGMGSDPNGTYLTRNALN